MLNRHRALDLLVEHDLFGKPVSTFPDHALDLWWGMIFTENGIHFSGSCSSALEQKTAGSDARVAAAAGRAG
jgi:hypothetical protein